MLRLTLPPVLWVFLGVAVALAQSTGELTGTVTDATGAVVPNAELSLVAPATGVAVKGATNQEGIYRFTGLNPGIYNLTVRHAGFAETRVSNIVVEVNRITRADATLSVSATAAEVQVVASGQLLDFESGAKGTVLSIEQSRDLPLQSRNPLALMTLTPGVVSAVAATGADPTVRQGSDGTMATTRFNINGGLRTDNGGFVEFVVDGISVTNQRDGSVSALPAADALQEFRVQSGGMGPEVGRTIGGVVNYVTRSGANEFHGNLFASNRNTATTARRALPAVGDKPVNNFNQFGGSFGGPIRVPGFFDGRNRTFFFFGYEGSRWLRKNPTLDTVPTARMRTGDFSEIAIRTFDPASAATPSARTPFAGNLLPASRINRFGKNILDAYPLPTRPGVAGNFDGCFCVLTPVDNYTGRVDQAISARQRIMGRVTWIESVNNQGWNLGPNDGRAGVSNLPSRNATVNYSFTIRPSLLYTLSAGYTWFHRTFFDPSGNTAGASFFGFTVNPAPPTKLSNIRPIVSFDIYRPIGGNTVEDQLAENWQLNQSLSWIAGRHTFRFGTDLRRFVAGGQLTVGAPTGSFAFNPLQTSQGTASTGYSAASALLGLANTGSFSQPPQLQVAKNAPSFFVQDDFRATERLTLNLGLRLDYEGALGESKNRVGFFDGDAIHPVVNRAGLFRYAGLEGAPSSIARSVLAWSPRIGFSWAPGASRKTAVRGAFGIYNAPVQMIGPYAAAIGFEPVLEFVRPTATEPAVVLRESYTLPPAAGPLGTAAYLGQSVSQIFNRELRPPRIYQWNFGFQRELASNLVIEMLYTGNRGSRLFTVENIDLPPFAVIQEAIDRTRQTGNPAAALNFLNELLPNPLAGKVPGALGAQTVARSQLTSRFPHYNGVRPTLNARDSIYHAMQATAQKRLSSSLNFLLAYTWSKLLTNLNTLQNPYELRDARGCAGVDRTHVLSANFIYHLPLGKGRRWAASSVAGAIFGGFQLNGILRANSGSPFSVTQSASNGLGVGSARPDAIGDPAARSKETRGRVAANGNVIWVDRSSYQLVNGRFGMAPASDSRLREPGFSQLDLGLIRNFRIREALQLRFNAQAFNALNHTNLVGLQGNLNSPTFGEVNAVADPRIFQFGLELRF